MAEDTQYMDEPNISGSHVMLTVISYPLILGRMNNI
jgi:hypothetical protein